jgi:hypothetical protein
MGGSHDFAEQSHLLSSMAQHIEWRNIERFWGFFIPENQTANGISKRILE